MPYDDNFIDRIWILKDHQKLDITVLVFDYLLD